MHDVAQSGLDSSMILYRVTFWINYESITLHPNESNSFRNLLLFTETSNAYTISMFVD